MNIIWRVQYLSSRGAVSTLLKKSQLTSDINLPELFETSQCCFKSSFMEFYKQVLAEICASKSAFNGPFIGSNRLRLTHQLKKSELCSGFSKPASPFLVSCLLDPLHAPLLRLLGWSIRLPDEWRLPATTEINKKTIPIHTHQAICFFLVYQWQTPFNHSVQYMSRNKTKPHLLLHILNTQHVINVDLNLSCARANSLPICCSLTKRPPASENR